MSTSTVCRAAARHVPRIGVAAAMAIPNMLAAVRSVQTAAATTNTAAHHFGAVDWEKIRRDQQRRARLAQHATMSPLSISSANQVDWDRIKAEQARRHRLAAHATAHLRAPRA